MAKTSNEAEAALTVAPTQTLGAPNVSGLDIDISDINIPRINIVQKMSNIEAPFGSIVYDKKYVIGKPETPISAIIVNAVKGWKEDTKFESGAISRVARTQEEKVALEADTEWPVIEFADITLLIRQPEGEENEEAFALPIGDTNYALGKLYVHKYGYRDTYSRMVTFAFLNRNTPLQSRIWKLQSQRKETSRAVWYDPSLTITPEATPEEVVAYLQVAFA